MVTKGRAMAQYNHAYATEEEAEKKANKRTRKKKGDSDREEDRSWAMTALYSTPIDVRDRVLEWYRKHISEFKEKEKRERQAAGRAKRARQRKKKICRCGVLNEHGTGVQQMVGSQGMAKQNPRQTGWGNSASSDWCADD